MSAIYLQIQKDLLQKIKTGVYPVGDTIPAETLLAKEYQVSRPTVRQAISLLVEQGILERKRKRGTIVCPPKIDQSFTQRINSFDSEMHQKGHTSQTQVLAFYKEPASDEVKRVVNMFLNWFVFVLSTIHLMYLSQLICPMNYSPILKPLISPEILFMSNVKEADILLHPLPAI